MAKFKSRVTKKINCRDIIDFTDGSYDLELLDIINDVVKKKSSDDFISAPGAFVYELDLTIDEKKVVELGVLGFRVEIFNRSPNKRLKRWSRSTRTWLRKRSILRQYLIRRVPKPILSFGIDLNVPLPTKSFQFLGSFATRRSAKGVLLVDKKTTTIYPETKKYVKEVYFSSAPLTSNSLNSAKITAKPDPTVIKNNGKGNSFSAAAKASVFKDGQDPAMMLSAATPAYPTLSAKVSKASVKLNEKSISTSTGISAVANQRVSLDNILVRQSLVEERENSKDQNEDDSPQAVQLSSIIENNQDSEDDEILTLGYKAEIESTLFNVRREIEIPKKLLGMRKNFYVRITPMLRDENTIIKSYSGNTLRQLRGIPIFFSVGHNSKVNDLLVPVYPPEMSLVLDKKGIVVLNIKQVDPTATNVSVSKLVMSPRKYKLSWQGLGDHSLDADSPRKIVSDLSAENIFPNTIIYRAVSKSSRGLVGPFTSVVIKGHTNVNMPDAAEESNELAIIAVNEDQRIKIDVERIPEDIVGIRLLREEIDETGELSSRVKTIPSINGKTLTDTYGHIKKISYYDYDVNLNRNYRYFCAMRPRLGGEFLSEEDEHITRKKSLKPLPVDVSLGELNLKEDRGQFIVSIPLLSTPKPSGVDFLLTILEKSGVSQVFIEQIKDQKSELANLACFIVERVNRVTGRRVSFGLQAPGTFSDDIEIREKLGLPNLVPECRYSYYFKLCLRPAQGFLKDALTKFSSGKTPGVDDKSVLSKKFESAFASAFGAIPSTKDLTDGLSVGSSFILGETGLTLQANVQTPKKRSLPRKLRLRFRKGKVYLSWRASGDDLSDINFCVVYVTYKGKINMIGTVPVTPSPATFVGNIFSFMDTHYAAQVGEKSYFVKFVYTDWSLSPESKKVKYSTVASLPSAYFAKNKKAKILGVVSSVSSKKKLASKGNLKMSDIGKNMNAPGWSSDELFKKGV
jgi:hypothetical protein